MEVLHIEVDVFCSTIFIGHFATEAIKLVHYGHPCSILRIVNRYPCTFFPSAIQFVLSLHCTCIWLSAMSPFPCLLLFLTMPVFLCIVLLMVENEIRFIECYLMQVLVSVLIQIYTCVEE